MTQQKLSIYEEAGLAGLVRAGEGGEWSFGHFGAAMAAGGALLRNPDLPDEAAEALRAVLDRLLRAHADWFGALDDTSAPADVGELA